MLAQRSRNEAHARHKGVWYEAPVPRHIPGACKQPRMRVGQSLRRPNHVSFRGRVAPCGFLSSNGRVQMKTAVSHCMGSGLWAGLSAWRRGTAGGWCGHSTPPRQFLRTPSGVKTQGVGSCFQRHVLIVDLGLLRESKASANSVYFAMDGQRPMEELSEARNLEKVLGFRDARAGDREFAIEEFIDWTETTLTTVLRSPRDDDVRIGPLALPAPRCS